MVPIQNDSSSPTVWRAVCSAASERCDSVKTKKQRVQKIKQANACQLLNHIALSRPGGYGGAAAPVPIPNTAVKRPSANGTSSQDAGE